MKGYFFVAAFAMSCAAPTAQVADVDPAQAFPLARFMREELNVPFAFMMLETEASNEKRMHKAAIVLREAARDLVHWTDPPVTSDEGREVFYAYAQHLELRVGFLEDVAAQRDYDLAIDGIEEIRQTCNGCHRFFRPASVNSPDVAYDGYLPDHRGVQ